MRNKLPSQRVIFAAVFFAASLSFPEVSFSDIKNKGNEAVEIKVENADGSDSSFFLYPDQGRGIPDGAKSLMVSPRTFARGDTRIKVEVVESTGKMTELDRPGYPLVLGQKESSENKTVSYGRVRNKSNVGLDIVITYKDGITQNFHAYPGESKIIRPDLKQVQIGQTEHFRGDEKIKVEVLLPTGDVEYIESYGGTVTVEEQNKE